MITATEIVTDAVVVTDESRAAVRRYDIDWLRIILFGLLIWYHYILFVPPSNSVGESYPIRYIAEVMHEWRLAALFAISGMGTAFAFRHRTWQAYLKERGTRLLMPLLFVFYFLNGAIWTMFQSTQKFIALSAGIDMLQHMWFVYNLLIYSVVLTPLFQFIRDNPNARLVRAVSMMLIMRHGTGIMVFPPIMLAFIGILSRSWWRGGVEGFWWYFLFFHLAISC